MTRRDALARVLLPFLPVRALAAPVVSTLIGTGTPGHSDREVNNPYGVAIGPDGALYFCDLDNQRIRRLDLGRVDARRRRQRRSAATPATAGRPRRAR